MPRLRKRPLAEAEFDSPIEEKLEDLPFINITKT
jgi:hypothetical protein